MAQCERLSLVVSAGLGSTATPRSAPAQISRGRVAGPTSSVRVDLGRTAGLAVPSSGAARSSHRQPRASGAHMHRYVAVAAVWVAVALVLIVRPQWFAALRGKRRDALASHPIPGWLSYRAQARLAGIALFGMAALSVAVLVFSR